MLIREVRPEEKELYNAIVPHPLQSWEWGNFREKTGVDVVRLGQFDGTRLMAGFQITFHPVPKMPFTIGYMPRTALPDREVFGALKQLAKMKKAILIKLEPCLYKPADATKENQFSDIYQYLKEMGCCYGKPLFTKYSFMLDLTQTENELLANMKQKTRYNVGLAHRKGVTIVEDNSYDALETYLRLTFEETTKRQRFYAHDREYHRKMWDAMHAANIAHLLKAQCEGETLVTWVLFTFNNVLYYPYGASSSKDRQVMASNMMMWEAIRFGKHNGCKLFDMWGSLGPNPNPNDPWTGFHHFKEGYGPTLMEFAGTYDLVIDPPKYQLYTLADSLRWKWLKIKTKLPL
jgi:lipid II:glycine glycyltransferase (peptidoglycan interpeptide bridge formation enzyme)